jgi:hypothetical protein
MGAVVNNAGYGQPGALEDLSRSALRKQFEANVLGHAGFHESVHSRFAGAAKRGRIVLVTFGAGTRGDSAHGRLLRQQIRAGGDRRRTADGAGAGGHFGVDCGAGPDQDVFPEACGQRGGPRARNAQFGVCGAALREGAERSRNAPTRGRRTCSSKPPEAVAKTDRACAWNRAIRACAVSGDGRGLARENLRRGFSRQGSRTRLLASKVIGREVN